jgi:hypothetical protein
MEVLPPTPGTEDDDEASIPAEHALNGPHGPDGPLLSAGNRKVAKRTFPFDLKIGETIQLALPQPPQAEDIRETKRRRLEEPFPASTDEATTGNTPHATTVALPPPDAAADTGATDPDDPDPVMDMYPNAGTTGALRHWTSEENAKLSSAVKKNREKKWGKKYRINWKAIAALVPGRTKTQCQNRWNKRVVSLIDPTTARAGKWTADEDKKLKDGVREHGGKNWKAIAALVIGRTREQCRKRWQDTLRSNIHPTTARTGKWTSDEDKKLEDSVREHGGKNWNAIAALVPGRTKTQCQNRWHDNLVSNLDPTTARTGKWTADEDKALKDGVRAHGGKNWGEIAPLVPGRTRTQCRRRWHDNLVSNNDSTMALAGKWTADEDKKLRDLVREHGGKNWKAIAASVIGRTKKQCHSRWHDTLGVNIDLTTGRKGAWKEDEDSKLKYAVQKYGGREWDAIAALVPSRTKLQCRNRWHNFLNKTA